jgi:hypothetical protein
MGVADRLPVFCWLVASISILVLFAGIITSIAGNTEITTYSGRFAAFDVVPCTVDEIKVIEFKSGLITQNVAVAGVSVRDKLGLFAAIRQAATPKRLIDHSPAEAVKTLNVQVGREYSCGFPTDAVAPTSFNAVRVGPADLENVIPLTFPLKMPSSSSTRRSEPSSPVGFCSALAASRLCSFCSRSLISRLPRMPTIASAACRRAAFRAQRSANWKHASTRRGQRQSSPRQQRQGCEWSDFKACAERWRVGATAGLRFAGRHQKKLSLNL